MRKTYKYRIYPSKVKIKLLDSTLDVCRNLYNKSLEYKKCCWENDKRSVSLYDLNHKILEWKKQDKILTSVYSQVLQKTQERLDLAFQSFFRRFKNGEKPGYPRFKGKNQFNCICFKQAGWKFNDNTKILTLSKIGDIKVNYHRPICGKIKTVSIIKRPTGKFYVCFSVEIENLIYPSNNNKSVGIDSGCKTLLTFSDGKKIDNPRFLKQEEKELNSRMSKRDLAKNSQNWSVYKKEVKKIRRVFERLNNRRNNLAFQIASFLVKNYNLIVFEDLNIESMNSYSSRNKSIRDAAWNNIVKKTQYKAEWAGKRVILVNPCNTSKTCSRCGQIHKDFDISKEFMDCECGNYMQRDENASLNILRLGLQSLVKA